MQEDTQIASILEIESTDVLPGIAGREGYYFVKRLADMVVAGILLVVLSIPMAIVAAAIFIYSPGPIFFKQERVGSRRIRRDGQNFWKPQNFTCYKFRTMKVNADPSVHQAYVKALIENNQKAMDAAQEAATCPRGTVSQEQRLASQNAATRPRKLVDDARIIRPGRILRKFSLDELPQFWNVLRGDMSLIGPRPANPYEVDCYRSWHLRRLEAQPGISGLQQVKKRCIDDFDEQVKLDIEYIEHQSLWLDIKIAIQTPLAILFARGAY